MRCSYGTRRLLEEVGDVVSTAAGPRERLAVVGELGGHDASWLVAGRSTHVARPVVLHPETTSAPQALHVARHC